MSSLNTLYTQSLTIDYFNLQNQQMENLNKIIMELFLENYQGTLYLENYQITLSSENYRRTLSLENYQGTLSIVVHSKYFYIL